MAEMTLERACEVFNEHRYSGRYDWEPYAGEAVSVGTGWDAYRIRLGSSVAIETALRLEWDAAPPPREAAEGDGDGPAPLSREFREAAEAEWVCGPLMASRPAAGDAWIPVAERLPEAEDGGMPFSDNVLVFARAKSKPWVGYYDHRVGQWFSPQGRRRDDVTHWQPLPPPPERGESADE